MSQKLPDSHKSPITDQANISSCCYGKGLDTISISLDLSRHTSVSCPHYEGFGEADVEPVSFSYLANGGAL